MDPQLAVRRLLGRVRARWRNLTVLGAAARAFTAAALVVAVGAALAVLARHAPIALALAGSATAVAATAVALRALWPLRRVPSDASVARFVEERVPSLEDRLVSAVHLVSSPSSRGLQLAQPMIADAAARAADLDLDAIVPRGAIVRAASRCAAAALVLVALLVAARGLVREWWDTSVALAAPERVRIAVTPGHVRVRAGSPLAIEARFAGNRAPLQPVLEIADGRGGWRRSPMTAVRDGYGARIDEVTAPFEYRVTAGRVVSSGFRVDVARPPRVTRVDVDYRYPAGLRLAPRSEHDGGDIYAPAGTEVAVHVHTDRPAARAALAFTDGASLPLQARTPGVADAAFTVSRDGSYRITLADAEGLASDGDTEYFVRVLQDRPPEVHVTRPASDRTVTPLEEVDIEAEADDDHGIDRLDLVYSVRGGPERTVAFAVPPRATTVTSRRTLYLEDLDVAPGDFVSYYVRARDQARGTRASEARSDIFFLEVKPFEQEFALAQSQSMAGGGTTASLDDLVNAQKQVVVATWKLDRRGRSAAAQSAGDVRAVARTEADLKIRVERTSSSFRESTMRDPRRPGRNTGPRAGQTMPEEDAMTAASEAMGRAVAALDALKTGDALPPELEALNHLLKAQADVKRRQVQRQQAGAGGAGNNNRNYDISTLFDRELRRSQQTNYEAPRGSSQNAPPPDEALERVKDLARRQDELNRRQAQLARDRDGMDDDRMKRELERLTREQAELRQQLEDLADRAQARQGGQASSSGGRGGEQGGPSSSSGDSGRRMREASEQMRSAANDLRRQDPAQASAKGSRALQALRDVQQQLERGAGGGAPRRAGDLQLEAKELAEAERQIGRTLDASRRGDGATDADARRRAAGDQARLAERARRLEQDTRAQAGGQASDNAARTAASGAARALERERLSDRMQAAADRLRDAGSAGGERAGRGAQAADSTPESLARSLDRVADAFGASGTAGDARSEKLADQLARARQLRERLDELGRQSKALADGQAGGREGARPDRGDQGRSGRGEAGGNTAADAARLRDEYARRLREARELLDEMRRDDPRTAQGGAGFTLEGPGMVLSAPGTEAFKQDFGRWEELRRQATTALDTAQTALAKNLQGATGQARVASGGDERVPPLYQRRVDRYFKAIAGKR